jgi:nucleotide-binding universal stress UspA family protein
MKLLIATDFSPSSCVAEAVNHRPWPAGTEVLILHVIDAGLFEFGGEAVEAAKQCAVAPLDAIAKKLDPRRFKIETKIASAYPRTEIASYAKQWGADFVFIGAHRHSAPIQFLLGSIARAIVRNAPCSVVIVRPHEPGAAKSANEFRVLVATDGSACAKAAVDSVAKRSWFSNAVFKVLSVVPAFMPIGDAGIAYFYTNQTQEAIEIMEREAKNAATQARRAGQDTLKQAGLKATAEEALLDGDPKSVILEEAARWGADLIIVGSHGRHGVDRLMMGSVSEAVAVHAPCSVEVFRNVATNVNQEGKSKAA